MTQQDKDQIVSQLRKEAEEKREQWKVIQGVQNHNREIAYTLYIQSDTYAKLATIFESLRTE